MQEEVKSMDRPRIAVHQHTWTYVASDKNILRGCTLCGMSFVLGGSDVIQDYRWKQVSEPWHMPLQSEE